jgi:hypothetical protein
MRISCATFGKWRTVLFTAPLILNSFVFWVIMQSEVVWNQRFGTTYWSHLQGLSWLLMMGQIGGPKMSVLKYLMLRNDPEYRRIQFNCGRSLQSCNVNSKFYITQNQIHFSIWNDTGREPDNKKSMILLLLKNICLAQWVYVGMWVYMYIWMCDEKMNICICACVYGWSV